MFDLYNCSLVEGMLDTGSANKDGKDIRILEENEQKCKFDIE